MDLPPYTHLTGVRQGCHCIKVLLFSKDMLIFFFTTEMYFLEVWFVDCIITLMKRLLFLTAKREVMYVMYVFSKLSAICNSAHTWNRSSLLVNNSHPACYYNEKPFFRIHGLFVYIADGFTCGWSLLESQSIMLCTALNPSNNPAAHGRSNTKSHKYELAEQRFWLSNHTVSYL